MCYQFTAQEEEEITILCKHIIYYIFSFKCDFHRILFSMWDFQPSLRQRIFSALGDFSENPKKKLAREKKKRKRLRYSQKKKVGRKSWICRTGGPRQALGFRWGPILDLDLPPPPLGFVCAFHWILLTAFKKILGKMTVILCQVLTEDLFWTMKTFIKTVWHWEGKTCCLAFCWSSRYLSSG